MKARTQAQPGSKPSGPAMDSGLRIRVERELREAFVEVCRARGRGASEVLREYMRSVAQHHHQQSDLFVDATRQRN